MAKVKTEYVFACPHCKAISYSTNQYARYIPCECGYTALKFKRYTKYQLETESKYGDISKSIDEFFYPKDIDITSPDWIEENVIDSIPYIKKDKWEKKKGKDYSFWNNMFIQLPIWLAFLAFALAGGIISSILMISIIGLIIYKLYESGGMSLETKRVHAINERKKRNMECLHKADDSSYTELEKKTLKILNWESYKINEPNRDTNIWRGKKLQEIYLDVIRDEKVRRDNSIPKLFGYENSSYCDPELERKISLYFNTKLTEKEILDYIMMHDVTYYFDLDLERKYGRW